MVNPGQLELEREVTIFAPETQETNVSLWKLMYPVLRRKKNVLWFCTIFFIGLCLHWILYITTSYIYKTHKKSDKTSTTWPEV
jgi:hypothetical protein